MRFAIYIFDAYSHQDPALTVFLHFARPVPSEMKITKIDPRMVLGGPGGMRRGAGGDFEGVLRSARCDLQFRTCAFDLTRQLLPNGKGGGFKRYAHSAGPD